jgi:methylmalonyl-CoA/ethylmalonyl-CoA epimerase
MIKSINHIAIVVPDLLKATTFYEQTLGANVSTPKELPLHGVKTAFVKLGDTAVELLEVFGEASPIKGFLEKTPTGGLHHISFEVDDINDALNRLKANGCRTLGDPKIGAHGTPVIFLHPKDCFGTLIELEESTKT